MSGRSWGEIRLYSVEVNGTGNWRHNFRGSTNPQTLTDLLNPCLGFNAFL